MRCNIDAKGKVVRLIYGIALLFAGIALIFFWSYGSASIVRWIVSIAVMLFGAFGVFESRKGWCIIRAMGFKTPI